MKALLVGEGRAGGFEGEDTWLKAGSEQKQGAGRGEGRL